MLCQSNEWETDMEEEYEFVTSDIVNMYMNISGVNNLHFAGNEKTGRKSSENEKPGSF